MPVIRFPSIKKCALRLGSVAQFLLLGTALSAAPLPAPDLYRNDYPWPTSMVGSNFSHTISEEETLIELARQTQLGYATLTTANPDVDPWLPDHGRQILVPHFAVVPAGTTPGITINLAELRLYYVGQGKDGTIVRVYPIGIGTADNPTPLGGFKVREKIVKPWWTVPADIRKERNLPRRVGPGPGNPLGEYWLGISPDGVGIHGTNEPYGVGRRSSHGCIRLYPEDIADLYPRVAVGTPVRIVYQPVKLGTRLDALFLEVHPDYLQRLRSPEEVVRQQLLALGWEGSLDRAEIARQLAAPRGIPRAIGYQLRDAALLAAKKKPGPLPDGNDPGVSADTQ